MEANTGKFITSNPDDTTVLAYVEPNPRKVVVLMDHGCASSAEQFLLMARQSSKVTLMGQASAGVLDYANVRTSATPPCKDIALYYATSRSRRIDKGWGIDNIGIQPKVQLTKDSDWIQEALKFLAK
jgi:C-terminal processing protease CtpA/Prc